MTSRGRDLGPLILAALCGWLLHISWHKWINIIWEYGRELYVPWRITCGQVLYKDIASLFGPFPPYWNALLFKTFGVSIMTLVSFNLLLTAGIAALIYRFFSYTTGNRVAFFATAVFLSIFAFRQNSLDQGDFSYICPYTYSVTYAVFFSLWALELFTKRHSSGRNAWWGAIGALTGLTALCRFEVFIFLAIALLAGFICTGILGKWPLKRFLKAGTIALACFFIPVGIAYLYFSTQLPLSQVWPSILGADHKWIEILHSHFYWKMIGLDDPLHNSIIMLGAAAGYGVVFIAFKSLCMGLDRLEKNDRRWEGAIFVLLGMVGIAQAAAWIAHDPYDLVFRGLPLLMIFMGGYWALLLIRHGQDEGQVRRVLPLLVMTLWGLLMLTKVFFKAQIEFEGFVYIMPAVMLFVALFQGLVPQYFERAHARGYFVSGASSILLGLMIIVGLGSMYHVYQSRNFKVQAGPDTVLCDKTADTMVVEIAAFLKDADKIMGPNANFVAYPEGIMLNFLTKRIIPGRYNSFIMVEKMDFGKQMLLSSLKRNRPDYVIMYHQSLPAHFDPRLALMYPNSIRIWILANYRPVWPIHYGINNQLTVLRRLE